MASTSKSVPMNQSEALFKAVSVAKMRTLIRLLEQGVDVNVQDSTLQTPLMRAVYITKTDVRTHVVRLLIRSGADVNVKDRIGRSVLAYCCLDHGREDVVRQLIGTRICDCNEADLDGNTPLIHAAKSNNPTVIRILVNSGHTKSHIDVNKANKVGQTPLSIAFNLGHRSCVSILVKEGQADVTAIVDKDSLRRMMNDGNQLLSVPGSSERRNNSYVSMASSASSLRLDRISIHSKGSYGDDGVQHEDTRSNHEDVFSDDERDANNSKYNLTSACFAISPLHKPLLTKRGPSGHQPLILPHDPQSPRTLRTENRPPLPPSKYQLDTSSIPIVVHTPDSRVCDRGKYRQQRPACINVNNIIAEPRLQASDELLYKRNRYQENRIIPSPFASRKQNLRPFNTSRKAPVYDTRPTSSRNRLGVAAADQRVSRSGILPTLQGGKINLVADRTGDGLRAKTV